MERGEVWLAHVDEVCPVVLLDENGPETFRAMIVVAPARRNIDNIALEVNLGRDEGLPREGVLRVAVPRPGRINGNWLVTVRRSALHERIGIVSAEKLGQIEELLRVGELEE